MNRRHAAVISLFLAGAIVLGMVATVRTARLGPSAAPRLTSAQIAQRERRLARAEAALRKAAARKPPALPALPAVPVRSAAVAAAAPQRVVYVRPAPVVHVIHRHGGEHESEGGGDGGGGFDD